MYKLYFYNHLIFKLLSILIKQIQIMYFLIVTPIHLVQNDRLKCSQYV